MSAIYQKAIDEQGDRGAPIFLTNLTICSVRYYGTKPKKTYFEVSEIVTKGTIKEIEKDPSALKRALKKHFGGKDRDEGKYSVYAVEIISFHGYSFENVK